MIEVRITGDTAEEVQKNLQGLLKGGISADELATALTNPNTEKSGPKPKAKTKKAAEPKPEVSEKSSSVEENSEKKTAVSTTEKTSEEPTSTTSGSDDQKEYSTDDVKEVVAWAIQQPKGRETIKSLLARYEAPKVSAIQPENRGEFIEHLKGVL